MRKAFVEVIVKCTKEGVILPLTIIWEDGKTYAIDKVMEICPAASFKAGGQGVRYKCKILGKITFLWLEENKWFVEAK